MYVKYYIIASPDIIYDVTTSLVNFYVKGSVMGAGFCMYTITREDVANLTENI